MFFFTAHVNTRLASPPLWICGPTRLALLLFLVPQRGAVHLRLLPAQIETSFSQI